jgi:hypothetical protein
MALNIVLLSDGTGNSAAKLFKTNVWRVYQALDLSDGSQVAYYDDGVGTSSFKPLALLGGAFGWGLKRNVISLYMFLCRNYRDGDRIYGFGFSRGAFTIRVLLSFILTKGLITDFYSSDDLRQKSRQLFRQFQVSQPGGGWLSRTIRSFVYHVIHLFHSTDISTKHIPEISFVGLWDTVDAYGMPIEEIKIAIDKYIWPLSLQDRRLDPKIKKACHALSIDDSRSSFRPLLWDESDLAERGDSLEQVWFPGVHSNVGGGYPDDDLSYGPLKWIISEAKRKGLVFDKHVLEQYAAHVVLFGKLYDSRRGLGAYYRYQPRSLNPPRDEQGACIPAPKIHESAIWRIACGADAYAPPNLPRKPLIAVTESEFDAVSGLTTYELPAYQAYIQGKAEHCDHLSVKPELLQRIARKVPSLEAPNAEALELVWDTIWWRRIVYFGTVCATFLLVGFPFLHQFGIHSPIWQPNSRAEDPLSRLLRAIYYVFDAMIIRVLDFIAPILPAAASYWIDVYRSAPLHLVLILLILAELLIIGREIDLRIRDRALAAWDTKWSALRLGWISQSAALHLKVSVILLVCFAVLVVLMGADVFLHSLNLHSKATNALAASLICLIGLGAAYCGLCGWRLACQRREGSSIALSLARTVRTSEFAARMYRIGSYIVAPRVVAVTLIIGTLVAFSGVSFSVMSAGGWVCPHGDGAQALDEFPEHSYVITPSTSHGCQSLLVKIVQGHSYRVKISHFQKPAPGLRAFGVLSLRRLDVPWFEPVVRVGDVEYFAKVRDPQSSEWVIDVKPQQSDEVFIFVNDVVIGLPFIWDIFYRTNDGKYEVTISEDRGI